jgi:hypothetical protein
VVNRCKRRLIGGIARQSHVEKILGYDNVRYVAEEPMALESINAGAPMALTNSYRAAAKDIADIAGFFADLKRSQVAVAQA